MKHQVTQIHHVTFDELTQTIIDGFEQKLNKLEKNFQPKEPNEWITTKQVCELLSVSHVTVSDWSKKKVLSPYRIGNRIRFRRLEVEKALTKINK